MTPVQIYWRRVLKLYGGSCLVELVSTSTCGIDVQCLCADPKLKTQVLSCVQKKCLPRDALATLNVTSVACDFPVRDRHAQFDILAITLIAITAIVVGLRLWHKVRYERKFRLDDYIVVAVFLLDLGNTIVCVHGLSGNGLGRDAWLFSPDTINSYLCYLYIGQTLYASDVFLTKICVALFYLRIFPVVSVQRLIWGTIVFSVLGMIIFDILAIAQCQPISFYWTGWDKLHEGHCLGVQPLAWAIAAVGIILDVWMLAIPIWQLVQLQMKWQRKLAVAIMFTVGTFVTIVSILRLRYLVAFGSSQNPTWDSFETCYWSVIEINVGLCDGKLQPRPSKASVHIAREDAPPFYKLDPRFQQDKWIRPKPPGSSCFSNEIVQWAYTRIEDDEGVEYPLLTLRHHKASKCIAGKACETGHWELIYDGVTTRVKGCIDLQLACMRTKHVEREMSSCKSGDFHDDEDRITIPPCKLFNALLPDFSSVTRAGYQVVIFRLVESWEDENFKRWAVDGVWIDSHGRVIGDMHDPDWL
ncbi:hypothetical protein FPRO06_10913 [Fusarium proliferatum]|nr:hypothetical protein FPRO06_10913 [Fusarium proliferatum]